MATTTKKISKAKSASGGKAAAPKKAAVKAVETIKETAKGALAVYTISGEKTADMAAPTSLFGGKINMQLIAQAIRVYLANQREGAAATKTRGLVEGSTRKIYKQKGTGRARHGSVRAPVFVGGGIVFGPQPRDFSLKLSQSMKNAAMKSALALKLTEGKVIAMEDGNMTKPATKTVAAAFEKMNATRSVLFVVDDMHTAMVKSARNIGSVTVVPAKNVTTYEVFVSHKLIMTKEALKQLETRLA